MKIFSRASAKVSKTARFPVAQLVDTSHGMNYIPRTIPYCQTYAKAVPWFVATFASVAPSARRTSAFRPEDDSHLESPDKHMKKHALLAFSRQLTRVLKLVEDHLS